jgi:hypothetical protein
VATRVTPPSAASAVGGGRPGLRAVPFVAFLVVCVGLLIPLCWHENRNGQMALRLLAPVMSYLADSGERLGAAVEKAYLYVGVTASLSLASFCAWLVFWRRNRGTAACLLPLILAVAGQTAFLVGGVALGVGLHALACAVALIVVSQARAATDPAERDMSPPPQAPRPLSWQPYRMTGEFIAFAVLFSVIIIVRFYGINRIPTFWDAEGAEHQLNATDLRTAVVYSLGLEDPHGTQGFLFHLVHFFLFKTVGLSLMAWRLPYSVFAVLLAAVFYAFLRTVWKDARAAWIGALLLAFSPSAMPWGRLDFFFNLPTLLVLVTCWVTYAAFATGKPHWLIAMAFMMALSDLDYPAAILGFTIPINMLLLLLVGGSCNRRHRLRRFTIPLALGTIGWVCGRSLLYRAVIGSWRWLAPVSTYGTGAGIFAQADSEGGGVARLAQILANHVQGFFKSLFVVAGKSHFSPLVGYDPVTFLPTVVAAVLPLSLLTIILRWKSRESCLHLAWIAATVPPGLFSIWVDARLFCTLFPALISVAAIYLSRVVGSVQRSLGRGSTRTAPALILAVVAVPLMLSQMTYFAQAPDVTPAEAIGRAVAGDVGPDELLVISRADGNPASNLFLVVAASQPGGIEYLPNIVVATDKNWPSLLASPKPDYSSLYYIGSFLHRRIPRGGGTTGMKEVTYAIFENDEGKKRIADLEGRYPGMGRHVTACQHWQCKLTLFEHIPVGSAPTTSHDEAGVP